MKKKLYGIAAALGLSVLSLAAGTQAEEADLTLMDQEGVKISLDGSYEEVSTQIHFQVIVENNTESNITVLYTGDVNDWSISSRYLGNASEIKAGTKAKGYLWFDRDDIDVATGDEIHSMQLDFTVKNKDDNSELFTVSTEDLGLDLQGGTITITGSAQDTAADAEEDASEDPFVLVDRDNVKISLAGTCRDVSTQAQADVIVENNTDSHLDILFTGSVNGWSINSCYLGGASDIKPHTKAKGYLWFTKEDIDVTDVSELTQMALEFTVKDKSNGNSELFTETLDPIDFTVEDGQIVLSGAGDAQDGSFAAAADGAENTEDTEAAEDAAGTSEDTANAEAEGTAYTAEEIEAALQGSWTLMEVNQFVFSDGTVDIKKNGEVVLTGTYSVNTNEEEIKAGFTASNGNVSVGLPYTTDGGVLTLFNDGGEALIKDGDASLTSAGGDGSFAAAAADSENKGLTLDPASFETLQNGSSGDAVVTLQKNLQAVGCLKGSADGAYGPGTEGAVKLFQETAGLEQTGIADGETQARRYEKQALLFDFTNADSSGVDTVDEPLASWYKDASGRATLFVLLEIKASTNGTLETKDLNLGDIYVGKNEKLGFLDVIIGKDPSGIVMFRYWPAEHKAIMGTAETEMTAAELAPQQVEKGILDSFEQAPISDIMKVVNAIS